MSFFMLDDPQYILQKTDPAQQQPPRTLAVAPLRERQPRSRKIERLCQGGKPRILDLFGGCGGMSLGFETAGFVLSGVVEFDPIAAKSHAENFFRSMDPADRERHAAARDITVTSPEGLVRELALGDLATSVDVIVGGPPCQAFARVGRAKLREIAEHPEAFKMDNRADLYLSFMEYIEAFQPLAVVMENVPDIVNFGGHNIPEEMCEALESKGYVCRYSLLNSVFYGVPQMRERMFLVAFTKELAADVSFPMPITKHELPQGYKGSKQVALKNVDELLDVGTHFITPPKPAQDLPPAVTAQEAMSDLPRITLHLEGKLKRGARRFTDLARYPNCEPMNDFARMMRTWNGYESAGGIYDHVIRYLPRDYAIFKRMEPGDQYPQAYRLAMRMLEEEVEKRLRPGSADKERNALRKSLRAEIVPPYDPGKFPNKWRKMEADAPSRTLMAHLGKDGYSHIHYDSSQARTISVREAARLQSFPDGFRFSGTMNPAFRQIGNAVPPLMAKAIAEVVRKTLPGHNR